MFINVIRYLETSCNKLLQRIIFKMFEVYKEEETKLSGFNEAQLQMMRIDKLQQTINTARFNPFERACNERGNPISYFFEIGFEGIKGLYFEISSRLKVFEDEKCIELKEDCETTIGDLYQYQQNLWFRKYGAECRNIIDALAKFEKYVRKMKDAHGYGSPAKSEGGMF